MNFLVHIPSRFNLTSATRSRQNACSCIRTFAAVAAFEFEPEGVPQSRSRHPVPSAAAVCLSTLTVRYALRRSSRTVQFLDDTDPFNSTNFPEPTRPPHFTFREDIPLINQIAGVHRLLKAPHKMIQTIHLADKVVQAFAHCAAFFSSQAERLASRLKPVTGDARVKLLDDCALQLSHNGSYLDLESTLAEQRDELEGFQLDGGFYNAFTSCYTGAKCKPNLITCILLGIHETFQSKAIRKTLKSYRTCSFISSTYQRPSVTARSSASP
ncbi:FH1/FH2 domain-containing protein 3 [Triplophysa tibetana]|uniref:FH1/FH2 domain-containing protein 3 n=1 Tax=Triplophysa tibetana TaxID=1572043 RepID=A0A5A9N1S6_9TELE|nr:FH1/FH2 domain-containing protein 3 [Triplophysa tibetana]